MSKTIKFRAWSTLHQEMFVPQNIEFDEYTDSIKGYESDHALQYDPQEGGFWHHSADEVELMQYTGLKDKNGAEIYEGDIVDQLDIQQIGNRENPRKQNVIEFNPTQGYDIWPHDVEVIGSIYENPDLINAK